MHIFAIRYVARFKSLPLPFVPPASRRRFFSVAQASADRRQRENDACAASRDVREVAKTRKHPRRCFAFDVWNLRYTAKLKNVIAHARKHQR
jgi:hypothetical protein